MQHAFQGRGKHTQDQLTIMRICTCICICLAILLLAAAGCGKKVWPEPDADEEKFSIHIKEVRLADQCLYLEAGIQGNYRNLAGLVLQVEKSHVPCPACPFLASSSVDLDFNSPEVLRRQDRISAVYCGIDPEHYYRVRLKGRNVYPDIRDVHSAVHRLY